MQTEAPLKSAQEAHPLVLSTTQIVIKWVEPHSLTDWATKSQMTMSINSTSSKKAWVVHPKRSKSKKSLFKRLKLAFRQVCSLPQSQTPWKLQVKCLTEVTKLTLNRSMDLPDSLRLRKSSLQSGPKRKSHWICLPSSMPKRLSLLQVNLWHNWKKILRCWLTSVTSLRYSA